MKLISRPGFPTSKTWPTDLDRHADDNEAGMWLRLHNGDYGRLGICRQVY